MRAGWLDENALDFIEADFIAAAVVEVGGGGGGGGGGHRRFFERAAALEIGCDAGGPEGVIADPGAEACRPRPALDHRIRVRLLPSAGVGAPRKQRRLLHAAMGVIWTV